MGWLRDFMGASEPPVASYGRLATACLGHSAWPSTLDLKERSLATLFSKMDRGQDLDWLRERLEVQQVLSEVLSRPVSDLRAAVGESRSSSQDRFVRLDDVRFAREIDLSEEELPPGLPSRVLSPVEWGALVWVTEAGAGRSLLGRWLKVRGLSQVRTLRTEADLFRLPQRGPLYVEVSDELEASGFALTEAHFTHLRRGERPLLFATRNRVHLPGIDVVTSPPVQDFLPELIHWLSLRLDESGHFEADRAEAWMNKVALPSGAARTLGDALGLLGMLDEVSPRSLLAKSLDELAGQFLSRRVREAQQRTAQDPRLAEKVYPALKEVSARLLVSGKNALGAERTEQEWLQLLSLERQEDMPDPEWFTDALRGALGAQVSRRDLRRAAKHLEPGAFQIFRSLTAAALLRGDTSAAGTEPDAPALLHLGPRWIASLLEARAALEALRLAPSQWGLVLLGPSSETIMSYVRESARRGEFRPFFSVVDDFEEDVVELRACLEASVVALGMTEAEGIKVPEALKEDILGLCGETLMFVEGLPEPVFSRQTEEVVWFERAHFLAALAVLMHSTPGKHGHLSSFSSLAEGTRKHFASALESVLFARRSRSSLCLGLLRVLSELSSESALPATLRWLKSSGDEARDGLLLALRLASPETLLAYAQEQGLSEADFFKALWKLESEALDIVSLLQASLSGGNFITALLQALSEPLLLARARSGREILYEALLPHQFSAWLKDANAPPMNEQALRVCPLETALELLDERGSSAFTRSALVSLTERARGALAPYLSALVQRKALSEFEQLLSAVPRHASASIASALPSTQTLLSTSPELLTIVRKFLLRAVRERHADFPECYRRLMKLEAGVAPLRGLSP